jgi:cellulose biosynthesis protein BcsQ
MSVVAVYNMKGGVGKTTTAVNLAYLAAEGGQRVLLWDLDPQAASSFAFRVRPRVEGFKRGSLKSGDELVAAIRETDFPQLDVLPADFAYRKIDRLLHDLGKPERVVRKLIEKLGADYDLVVLDCPAGFSLLTEGILTAADVVLVPTIPTVLSVRTIARLIRRAERAESPADLLAFFSMVDRRKRLHRRACDWARNHPDIFLTAEVPYASIVEQMAVRRLPLAAFATRDPAAIAFAEIWTELRARLEQRASKDAGRSEDRPLRSWAARLRAIESLMARLERPDADDAAEAGTPVIDFGERRRTHRRALPEGGPLVGDAYVIHRFDTDERDLERNRHLLELHERKSSLLVVATLLGEDGAAVTARAQAQVDGSWAFEMLSGSMSPLTALERRLGRPGPAPIESARKIVGRGRLIRMESRSPAPAGAGPAAGRSEPEGEPSADARDAEAVRV